MAASVKVDKFKFDMGSYLGEKSLNVVRYLAQLSELMTRSSPDLPQNFVREMESLMSGALWDATKVLALAEDADWVPSDPNLIMEKGRDGLDGVLTKYGLELETDRWRELQGYRTKARHVLDSLSTLEELIRLPRGEARPQICAELIKVRGIGLKHPIIEELDELTERVTQGALDWPIYVNSVVRAMQIVSADLKARANIK